MFDASSCTVIWHIDCRVYFEYCYWPMQSQFAYALRCCSMMCLGVVVCTVRETSLACGAYIVRHDCWRCLLLNTFTPHSRLMCSVVSQRKDRTGHSMLARKHCRISPSRFLAECHKRWLNRVVLFCCILHCLLFLSCIVLVSCSVSFVSGWLWRLCRGGRM